jgi:hypothetical protein
MPGAVRWITNHRKLVIFIVGVALTAAIHAWGTGNPYVSLAVLAATGLGFYQTPDKAAPAKTGAGPVTVTPPPDPGNTVPAAVRSGVPDPPPRTALDSAAGTGGFPPSAFPGQS